MCSNAKKTACLVLITIYSVLDVLCNLFFITRAFTQKPWQSLELGQGFRIDESLIDVWCISLLRDVFLITVLTLVSVRHRFVHGFIKFVHNKFIGAFLCLMMYSYSMIKMLLHADQRKSTDPTSMTMFLWNIFASFAFFISIYMLALLKPKQSANYQKTDIDGGDPGDNALEEDILIGKLLGHQFSFSVATRILKLVINFQKRSKKQIRRDLRCLDYSNTQSQIYTWSLAELCSCLQERFVILF